LSSRFLGFKGRYGKRFRAVGKTQPYAGLSVLAVLVMQQLRQVIGQGFSCLLH
jgi:hypothetical protein